MTTLTPTAATPIKMVNKVDTENDVRKALRPQAEALESTFLSLMLAQSGFSPMQGTFGGGIGEEQFYSFLRDRYAAGMVNKGGLVLTESILTSLMKDSQNVIPK